jgi:hypothetical protein
MTMMEKEQDQQQEGREEKKYILVSATHGHKSKKLHWVVAEKRKRDDWFLKGKPVESLCGKRASKLGDSPSDVPPGKPVIQPDGSFKMVEGDNDFFFQYTEEELFEELKDNYERGYGRVKRKYWVNRNTGTPIEDIRSLSFEELKQGLARQVIEEKTLDDIKEEMWCKQCLKKKAELYPNL